MQRVSANPNVVPIEDWFDLSFQKKILLSAPKNFFFSD